MFRDSSLCFPISHRVQILSHVLWLDIRGTAGMKLGFSFPVSFPIRNLVSKCDLRCLVVWRFPNPIWRLDLGSVPAITALPILVGLTHPCRRLLRHMVQLCRIFLFSLVISRRILM